MSKKIKILTPRIYEHSDFFHNAVDFAREHSLNTNELCLELSHYLVDNFDKVWKIEKPRVYKRVADLEAKLAELREQITILDEENSKTFIKSVNAWRENAELKQQLAKKEREIEYLKLDITMNIFAKALAHKNQDKISFCIEQLEKVRNEIHGICFFTCDFKCDEIMLQKSDKIIDNQIEELKKEMK